MIRITLEEGRHSPRVVCDHCGKVIADAREGNYEWLCSVGGLAPATGEVFFTHKECCYAFEHARSGPELWMCDELTHLLSCLSTSPEEEDLPW